MLLTITTTHQPANDLGYLLHKHPGRFQSFDMSFGKAHVYYSEVAVEQCTACLLLDVDAVGLVRGKKPDQNFLLAQYVNDRPYAASSFMSVAIAQVFGSALQGRCKDRPELATTAIPLTARIDVLPVRGGERFLRGVFERNLLGVLQSIPSIPHCGYRQYASGAVFQRDLPSYRLPHVVYQGLPKQHVECEIRASHQHTYYKAPQCNKEWY